MIIAIDGPAAAGKGTLARELARHLGLPHLDTGLLYRAVGMGVLDRGGDPRDPAAALAVAERLVGGDLERLDLRGPTADDAAAAVAAMPPVRAALLAFQHRFGRQPGGAVLDGRDIGTVVFPDADAKFWVFASPEARGRRRWLESAARGEAVDEARVVAEVRARDARDAARLVPANDAMWLDTTRLDAADTFRAALRLMGDGARPAPRPGPRSEGEGAELAASPRGRVPG